MDYHQVLKELESALEEADNLEDGFKEGQESIKALEKVGIQAKNLGLTFSDEFYNDAKKKFDSGDYVGARETATSGHQKLDDCCSSFDLLTKSFSESNKSAVLGILATRAERS